jgi:hypothetical protein
MTLAVVVATEMVASGATPTAGLKLRSDTVVGHLLRGLEKLDIADRKVIARPDMAGALREIGCEVMESKGLADDLRAIARTARTAKQPVLVIQGDLAVNHEALLQLVLNSKAPANAVVRRGRVLTDSPCRPVMRIRRGRVVSAGSPYHQVTDPNALFHGALRVSAEQAATLADVAEEFAALLDMPDALTETDPVRWLWNTVEEPGEDAEETAPETSPAITDEIIGTTPATGDDVIALLLVGMVRSGVKVTGRSLPTLFTERVLDQEQADKAQAALDAIDEDRVRLNAAVKNNDGFFTTYAVSTYSRYIARWCARRRMTPNQVTAISMGISVVAALWFAQGQRWTMVVGAMCLYLAFVFDCVDGQLARYSRQFSTLGAWLDATFDRAKEYTVFAGLAAGSTAAIAGSAVHGGDVWYLAVAAMMVQTCRHMVDFAFGASRRRIPPEPIPVLPLAMPDDQVLDEPEPKRGRPKGSGLGSLAVWLSARSERIRVFHWFKKIIVLPIGERFALIALTAALFNAKVTFLALLIWGGVAMSYTVAGRLLRSLNQPRSAAL